MLKSYVIAASVMLSLPLTAQAQSQEQACEMYVNFETNEEMRSWRSVNDGVMGGLSSGGAKFDKGVMNFEGVINTNGGGFSSLRSSVVESALKEAGGVKLRIRSDGRAYKMTFRTNVTYRGRLISFQSPIPQTPKGQWEEVKVSFSELKGSLFGRALSGANFERSEVTEMGIILADGQDGPFRLEVDWIKDCKAIASKT
ncbi:MAG: CIA30 family protein [Hellea sp.]